MDGAAPALYADPVATDDVEALAFYATASPVSFRTFDACISLGLHTFHSSYSHIFCCVLAGCMKNRDAVAIHAGASSGDVDTPSLGCDGVISIRIRMKCVFIMRVL